MARPSPAARAVVFGGLHFALQIFLYALGFALGPHATNREVLGVSLYDVTAVVTFPFVALAERLPWSGAGIAALALNSIAWGGLFRLAESGLRKRGQHRRPPRG